MPATDAMFTIAPPPERSIASISYFMPRKVPRMLVRMPRLAPATRATFPASCCCGVLVMVIVCSLIWSASRRARPASGEPVQHRHGAGPVRPQVGQHVAVEARLGELAQHEGRQADVPAGVVDEDVVGVPDRLEQGGVVQPGLHLEPAGEVV